jgi:hypothetical protein
MIKFRVLTAMGLMLAMAVAGFGCRTYEQQAPPIDQRDRRDRGLQSKDVVDASDQLAQYLLQLPEFNQPVRRTVVVTNVDNRTGDRMMNYDMFIQRLRTNLGQYGRDRIMLIDNRQRVEHLRSAELETGRADTFGQGDGRAEIQGSVQPEFALYGTISELRRQGTSYYFCDFNLTNLQTREQIPLKPYEVRLAR